MRTRTQRMHTNRHSAFLLHCSRFLERWIRYQRPFPVADMDPGRYA